MVLKITNLHILRHLPIYWLYLLERYTIDNQRCTHTASKNFCLLRKHIIHDIPCALPSGAGASAADSPECPRPSSPSRAIPWDSCLIWDCTPAV